MHRIMWGTLYLMNKSSITKYVVAGVVVLAFVAYLIFANKNSTPVASNTPTGTPSTTGPTSTPTTVPPSGNPPTGSTTTASTTTTPTASAGKYKDGTYTGSVADAFYGNLQVSATIKGGAITDVTFLQAPSGGNSSVVSAMAEPALKQEAIATQSANVNVVSGATQDSEAFNQSLAVALAQAKN